MKTTVLALYLTLITACAIDPVELPARPDPDPSSMVSVEPETSSTTSPLVNACANQCRNRSNECFAVCDRFPNPFCESRCEQRFATCMQTCGCPFTEEFDRVVLDHVEPRNSFICAGARIGDPGRVYQVYDIFNRTERVRETLHCDGLTSQVVLSSTVSHAGLCTRRVAGTCSFSAHLEAGLCVF